MMMRSFWLNFQIERFCVSNHNVGIMPPFENIGNIFVGRQARSLVLPFIF